MKHIFIFILSASLFACANTEPKRTMTPQPNADPIVSLENVNNSTIKFAEKTGLVSYLCEQQSYRHNEQRLINQYSPIIVVQNPKTGSMEAVALPENMITKNYNPNVLPFDMQGCLVEGLKSGWERLGSQFLEFGKKLIKYGAGYALVDKALDRLGKGTTVNNSGEGDVRIVDGNDNTYTEAGGLPSDKFNQIDLEVTNEQTDEEKCIALGGDWIASESRCSDGNGGTIPIL